MNLSDHELEDLLRRAPVPVPPPTLEETLRPTFPAPEPVDGRNRQSHRGVPSRSVNPPGSAGGLRRWWPVLIPGLAAAAFAAGLVVQQLEMDNLREEVRTLETQLATVRAADTPAATLAPAANVQPDANAREDLERLRALLTGLAAEVQALEAGRAEADRLRAAIRALQAALPKELQDSLVLQERAGAIQCVNHMKQLGLAVRVWANDNEDEFPPNILSMTNELATPKILVCPSDEARRVAADWNSYTDANCSYEFLTPGPGKFETEPNRVLFRCPIHGSITLCDGSVQMAFAKDHPDRLQWVNGAWYMMRDDPGAFMVPNGGTSTEPGRQALEVRAGQESGAPTGGSLPPAVETALRQGTRVILPASMAERYGLTLQPGAVRATNEAGEVTVELLSQPASETAPDPAPQP